MLNKIRDRIRKDNLVENTALSSSYVEANSVDIGNLTGKVSLNSGSLTLAGSALRWGNLSIGCSNFYPSASHGSAVPAYVKHITDATRANSEYSGLIALSFPYQSASWREASFNTNLPARMKEGTTIYPYFHCRLSGSDENQVGKNLLLEVESIWTNINENLIHSASTEISTFNYTTTSASLASDNLAIPLPSGLTKSSSSVGSLLEVRFARIMKADGWSYPDISALNNDNFEGALLIKSFSINFIIDSLGAENEFTK